MPILRPVAKQVECFPLELAEVPLVAGSHFQPRNTRRSGNHRVLDLF